MAAKQLTQLPSATTFVSPPNPISPCHALMQPHLQTAACFLPCPPQLNHKGFGACEGMTITDPELLMSVMEAREEVEEAGSDRAVLQPLLDRMQGLEAGCVQVRVGAGAMELGKLGGWQPLLDCMLGLEAGCVQVRMGWMHGSWKLELELGSWVCRRRYAARGGLQACVQRCLGWDVVAEHTPVWPLHCRRFWSPTALRTLAAPGIPPLP